MSNWNYEALGFRSQKEMEESIERVKAELANPRSDLEIRAANKAKFDAKSKNGGIDFRGLEEGARLERLDRVVASKLYWEKEEAKQRAEQEEMNKFLRAAGEKIRQEKEAKAKKELAEQKAKAEKELEKQIYSRHGVKTEKQLKEEAAWKSLLKNLEGLDD